MTAPLKGEPLGCGTNEKPGGITAIGFSIGKKRGRKEDLLKRKAAAHGFRLPSEIRIPAGFEHRLTEWLTKIDQTVNKITNVSKSVICRCAR
jgi:hypothetical protein